MEGKGARDRFAVVNQGGKVYEGKFLIWVFEAHHSNQPFTHKRRQIDRLPLQECPVRVCNQGVEGLLFEYVVGYREMVGQRGGNLSQTPCVIEIEQAAGVQKKRM